MILMEKIKFHDLHLTQDLLPLDESDQVGRESVCSYTLMYISFEEENNGLGEGRVYFSLRCNNEYSISGDKSFIIILMASTFNKNGRSNQFICKNGRMEN